MKKLIGIAVAMFLIAVLGVQVGAQSEGEGYFDRPQVYIEDDIAIPTVVLGTGLPQPGQLVWNVSSAYLSSEKFRMDGTEVQKNLGVRLWALRVSAEKQVGKSALGVSLPISRTEIKGEISGLPASAHGHSIGDVMLYGKHKIWENEDGASVNAALALELPTGKDSMRFRESNTSTNAFYSGSTQRIPLGWQPGSGSTDLIAALAYNKTGYRKAYGAILAAKLNGKGDEDVRLGDVWLLGLNTTQALSADLAGSLGLTYRRAKNDSYPMLSSSDSPALAGTIQNGSSLSISPSIFYRTKHKLTVGLSFSFPIVKPDDGMVADTRWGIVLSM